MSSSSFLIEREDCEFVVNVCKSISGDFTDESCRTRAFSTLLNGYLGSSLHSRGLVIPNDNGRKPYETEASIMGLLPLFTSGIVPFLLNREDKNEKGQGGGDTYLQNACYYAKFHGQSINLELIRASCCPTFLVELVGPAICISGAVYHEFISIDPLTPMLYLFFLPHNPLMMQLARVFKALKMGLLELKEYYEKLQPAPESSMSSRSFSDPLCYPYLNTFSTSTQTFHFVYSNKILNGNGRVFEGKITSIENLSETQHEMKLNSPPSIGHEIIIKFVRRYGTAGHLLLSSQSPSLAPLLYSVLSVGAGWQMVVMEKISNLQSLPSDPTESMTKRLREAVGLLHSNNFVHGDLRSNNVLVSNDGNNLYLIDFDWCGKEDEDVYPYFMNGVDIQWADGASDGKKLKKRHDEEMLSRLIGEEQKLEDEDLVRKVSSISI